MVDLLAEAARLGAELPVPVAREIAESSNLREYLHRMSPANRREPLLDLFRQWQGLSAEAYGIALLTAAIAEDQRRRQQGIELVWTGPDSRIIPTRQTEQVLLNLIRCARKRLLVVSYAVYRIAKIREALASASGRGVQVRIILDVDDPVNIDGYNPLLSIGEPLLSCAEILYWPRDQRVPNADGRRGILHVKCLVADGIHLFISSANLTEQALRLNMELGVLITGTRYSRDVEEHFSALASDGVLRRLR